MAFLRASGITIRGRQTVQLRIIGLSCQDDIRPPPEAATIVGEPGSLRDHELPPDH